MASKQRSRAPKKERASNPLADLGIFDVPDLDVMDSDSDVDDNVLESELEAILSGKAPSKPMRPKKKVAPPLDFEQLAAEALKDPDEEENDDDDDESLLMDPDLLKELQGLSLDGDGDKLSHANEVPDLPNEEAHMPVICTEERTKPAGDIITLLSDRLTAYNEALTAAKALNDNSKVRRYNRAVKTLENLLKNAKAGRNVSEEDIPPAVKVPREEKQSTDSKRDSGPSDIVQDPVPSFIPSKNATNLINISVETQKHSSEEKDETLSDDCKNLIHRRDQYKIAALQAKRAGDKATALTYMKHCKTFDAVIEALKNGEPVDLTDMPPPPPIFEETIALAAHSNPQKDIEETQTSSAIEAAALSAASEPQDPTIFAAPPAPASVLEALEQRLQKYTSTKDAALAEGNNSKVRRLERIVKTYEKAIKDYKAGKSLNFDELPTPPGFAPIPVPGDMSMKAATQPDIKKIEEKTPAHSPDVKPVPVPKRSAPQVPSKIQKKPKVQRANTFDKQLEYLTERQKLFRQAALAAKKNGDLQQAKEYLRMSKGFDSMIEATKCGLPIDATSIPTPPQLETDFVIVDVSECVENPEGSSAELIETLENDLTKQIEVCTRNKEHFLRLGDVSSASKFEKLGLDSRKDLSVIRHLIKTGGSVPKFHYETRLFSMVQCHTDLSDSELEVTLERGINLPGKPDDLDTYVKIEFPIPSDSPQRTRSQTIRDTNNPIYQECTKFEFNRKSRSQLRQFKRSALKLEVFSKGGFLRSDALLGTVNIKLVDLESKCTIHDCFDLMDGRKACGGKLEVKIRIRDPLLVKQVEEVREKWLVIGS